MQPNIIIRLLLPIPLIVDGIRMARGVTGGKNTDDIDRLLINISQACDNLVAVLRDKESA